ncbi:histone lysine demethylase PHF8-like [Penaeus chinensis]|uniref:histone lysine demethylase PHF8-like n=1 Tax=Penaeus chinensis TaxID=139456 RepID=UPI001FB6F997|nr:histone lysine demethylase PHF8-like [Penaeus chinensis]
MALDVIYCLCGQSTDLSRFMIQCDICKDWFHGRCVGVREYQAVDIDRFHCPRCEVYNGPSVLKARLNWHRHDYSESDAGSKPVQTGTQVFIKELKSRHFPSSEDIVHRLRGQQLTLPYIINNGFNKPILVEDKNGLDLIVPHDSFNVLDVENYVGSEHEVDVIDVQRQTDVKMQLHEFIEYFLSPARTTVLNLISLEFSNTSLSQLVEPPYIVRKLCWVTSSWPTDPPPGPPLSRPNVSKYVLIGVENSYTDFHIDFGGTSVWYHVLWGEKVFYLIKPTPANLALYQRWMKANNQSEMFFGDQVDACYRCVVRAGETLFIPTGWIHAVLTPTDTLVFGGNFLHSQNIDLQLQVYEIEKQTAAPEKFRFPHYETVSWYAATRLVTELRDMGAAGTRVPPIMIAGARSLAAALRQWGGENGRGGLEPVPPGIQPLKLFKDLQREIRSAEKQVIALNPPKPERESKRKKKKVLADDFIDYTNLTSFNNVLEERLPDKKVKVMKVNSPQVELSSSDFANLTEDQRRTLKLSLPKSATYPYGLSFTSSDYGMSGTPPHDPEYPQFKNEYPTNVKTEYDWSDSPGITPYKLVEPGGVRVRLGRTGSTDSDVPSTPTAASTLRVKIERRETIEKQNNESVYDFHEDGDSDEREPSGLMIDETPRRKGVRTQSQEPLKIKLSLAGTEVVCGESVDVAEEVEVAPSHNAAHNGIDELLRASAYAPDFNEDSPARMDELDSESGRASPSTREAIAGMLSMSRVVPGGRTPSRKLGSGNARQPKPRRRYDDDENMSKVHQDEDYVYPSLDLSDDEDFPVFKPRGKKKGFKQAKKRHGNRKAETGQDSQDSQDASLGTHHFVRNKSSFFVKSETIVKIIVHRYAEMSLSFLLMVYFVSDMSLKRGLGMGMIMSMGMGMSMSAKYLAILKWKTQLRLSEVLKFGSWVLFSNIEQRTLNNIIRKQIQRQYLLHDDSMIRNLLQTFLEHYKFTVCMCDVLGHSFCKRLVLYIYWCLRAGIAGARSSGEPLRETWSAEAPVKGVRSECILRQQLSCQGDYAKTLGWLSRWAWKSIRGRAQG